MGAVYRVPNECRKRDGNGTVASVARGVSIDGRLPFVSVFIYVFEHQSPEL